MTSVLVDTNVFIDVFGPEARFKEWSSEMILRLRPRRLLTRDAARYRTYFPSLDIISPETHS
ncbi:hypothetical protein LJR258_003003 [Rhizobium sp. LjRoot258]